jgi:phosphonate transport system permease protein
MLYGIAQQVLLSVVGVGVFRWGINIRESTILGLTGAGGIRSLSNGSINTLAWIQVSMILLAILSTVLVREWVFAKVRRARM